MREPKPCAFPRCPAFADKGREYCPVHRPERVIERAKSIVIHRFASAGSRDLVKLLDDIIHDLGATV